MPDLSNSQRRLYKATYAPVQADKPARTFRGAVKSAFVGALAIRPAEMDAIKRRLSTDNDPNLAAAVSAVDKQVRDVSPGSALRNMPGLAIVDANLLLRIGQALLEERSAAAEHTENLISNIRSAYRAWLTQPSQPATPVSEAPPTDSPQRPAHTIETRDRRNRPVRISRDEFGPREAGQGEGRGFRLRAELIPGDAAINADVAIVVTPTATIEDAISWAAQHQPAAFAELQTMTIARAPVPLAYSNVEPARALSYVVAKVDNSVSSTHAVIAAFAEHMQVEPVGRLHLERLEMTPVGVERGELVSSIPLTPKETVNISHREWSVTTEEFESIIQDYFEGYSEQGVSEKTDAAQSTENQTKHSSALSFGSSVTASYLGVTLSSSLGYNSTSDDQQAQKDSRNHSIASTRQASARTKKDHKTTFRVSSVAGTEDRAVRVITNPSDTESMRVDYYQLMRKWRVDLYRYGLRMTYDIVIPSPGADLMRTIEDVAALDAKINTPFAFSMAPSDITRTNWENVAANYQASVDPPPKQTQSFMASANVQTSDADKEKFFVGAVEFDVDTDYEITSGDVIVQYYYHDISPDAFALLLDVQFDPSPQVTTTLFDQYPGGALQGGIIGRTGHVSIGYFHRGVATAKITVTYEVTLRDDVFKAWQFRAWSAIRTAAEQQYEQSRQQLKDQRAALAAQIAPFDALTLRRMELEEIEKGVMRWLFGPAFNVTPADIQQILNKMAANDPLKNDALDPSSLTNQQWQRMLEFGEFIKYVQQAIEWENVLYFVYPYFWDTPKNWTLKQFLQHPDAIHRTFLRAGSARVVLTIRPGFETSFAQLIETGGFGQLPGDHPYVTIAQEIQNYANTNYPGIPPANPANPPDEKTVNQAERGVLQATWWEYTPTSALDVQLNTSLPEMA